MQQTQQYMDKIDLTDKLLSVEVDEEVIEKVNTGEITRIGLDITDENCMEILENIDGALALVTDELPNTYHGCYYYNNGDFPYAIKESLYFLLLENGDDYSLTKIIGVSFEPGVRFRFQGEGKSRVEDPNGDCCIWEIRFEVVPVPAEPRHYLMRWNPSISSFTEEDYKECIDNRENGMFRMNWSIYDWQEARRGDFFSMMRTGDDKAGIVFTGQFITDPYPGDDWAGSNRRRMYVDMVCVGLPETLENPVVSLEQLKEAIPSTDWERGHSGELMSEEVAYKLGGLINKYLSQKNDGQHGYIEPLDQEPYYN